MNKYTETFGIDISKAVFDCYGSNQGHFQFKNTEKGFVKFLKTLKDNTLVVMEATGYYHYRLAQFLYKKKYHCLCCKSIVSKAIYPDEISQSKNR